MGVKLDFLDLEGSGQEGTELIYLVQNERRKKAVVNTDLNLDFHNVWELSWLAEEPVVSEGKIWTMEF